MTAESDINFSRIEKAIDFLHENCLIYPAVVLLTSSRHIHLDILRNRLSVNPVLPFWKTHDKFEKEYEKRLG